MNDCSVPVGGPRERMPRRMYGLSLFCVFAGLAVLIGGFIVLSTSVFDEMNARAHLVIPGGYAVMSDDEFIRSVLPVAGVAGAIHLAGVIAGFVGRRYAEDRAEIGRCALGVGVNAFFLGCAGIIPAAGLSAYPGSLAVLLAVCGGAVLSACFSLFERFFSSAGAKSVGVGVAGLLMMGGAMLVGLVAELHDVATALEDPFLPGLLVVGVFVFVFVPVGIAQLTGVIMGMRAHRSADSEGERRLATWGIILNGPMCLCVLFLPLAVLASFA
ncbi:MAG: hypothetical protein ACLR2J_05700 [Actinomyces sp.]